MRIRSLVCTGSAVVVCSIVSTARAGGLFLPGAGAESTSRAGASVVATDDGEALSLNPANLTRMSGTTITISAVAISYAMKFARSGTYDMDNEHPEAYNGQPYPIVTNASKPKLGFGSYQPVPVIAVTSDLGGAIPHLRAAIGLYAPNAYPFRSMGEGYKLPTSMNDDFSIAPPSTRYDIIHQDAAVLLPSIAVAYSVLPELAIGARFSWGIANLESKTTIWGTPANDIESVRHDGIIDIKAKDNFAPTFGLGATYSVTPAIEVAANYNYAVSINAKGDLTSANGVDVAIAGQPIFIGPPQGAPACEAGSTFAKQKACVSFDLPMSAQVGGRYKFLDRDGRTMGDVELDLDWENWGSDRAGNYNVVADAAGYFQDATQPASAPPTYVLGLKPTVIHHGLKDTYAARVGGSYAVDLDRNRGDQIVFRGGVGYDTAAAKAGWLRTDLDGAARTTFAVGAGYKARTWEINAGFSYIYEGSNTNPGNCNPTIANPGCDGSGVEAKPANRTGPDPTDPTTNDATQVQSPFNQGTITSHYLMFMLGATKQF